MVKDLDEEIVKKLGYHPYGMLTKDLFTNIFPQDGKSEQRRFYDSLKYLRKKDKARFIEIGRKKINYLPEYDDNIRVRYPKEYQDAYSKNKTYQRAIIPLQVQIERTKKYQEKVLQPLFDWFNIEVMYKLRDIYIDDYIEDYSCVKDESRLENLLEYGPEYFRREFDVWTSSLFDKRGRDLENQFRDNHDPELFKMIGEFDIKYSDYWRLYFDINDIIRERIMNIMGLRIIDIRSATQDVNEEKIDSVTTNLQFLIYDQLYRPIIPFDSKKYFPREDRRYGECIDAPYEKYEFWYGIGRIECLLTEKEKGRNPEQFLEETDKKIKKIIMELRESKEVTDLYEKIRPLHSELEKLEARIFRRLKNHLDKEVLDGQWGDISLPKE